MIKQPTLNPGTLLISCTWTVIDLPPSRIARHECTNAVVKGGINSSKMLRRGGDDDDDDLGTGLNQRTRVQRELGKKRLCHTEI